mgnify:FL=1
MEIAFILLKQIVIMFILMGIGALLYKKKIISDQGSKDIGKILLYCVIPVVIVKNFCIKMTPEVLTTLLHEVILTLLVYGIAMGVAALVFGRRNPIAHFSAAFCNAGFIGIPLVSAVLCAEAVFYITALIVLVNILQWTYGVFIMTGDTSAISLNKIIKNPVIISLAIGIVIFVLQIPIPEMVSSIFTTISNLNTPLAMMVSGVYLAQSDLVAALKKKEPYMVALIRLIVIPIITILVFKFIPVGALELKLAILIPALGPTGSNVAVFAQQYDQDYVSAVEQVCVTTILCLFTLPIAIGIAKMLL